MNKTNVCEVVCIRHSKYDGLNPPDLTCRHCCSVYIRMVEKRQALLKIQNIDDDFNKFLNKHGYGWGCNESK